MQALVLALTAGTNLTHAGRFALTTFLHTIGMDVTGIAGMYARSPDFDQEKTMYQVEHITGRGGSGTDTRTGMSGDEDDRALCNRDRLCENVNHPLNYYRQKKQYLLRIKKEAVTATDDLPDRFSRSLIFLIQKY